VLHPVKRVMKTLVLLIAILAAIPDDTTAQVKKNGKRSEATATRKVTTAGSKKASPPAVVMQSSGSYAAKAPAAPNSFSIADPLVRSLNQRAGGNPVRISSSGIVGMPRMAYGLAHGRIMLRSTYATTSGTSTGTPSVGTGSTLSTIGSTGRFIGLNGKSPDAGSAMWGNARGLINPYSSKNN
jgi:hypothetical protein